MIKTTIIGKKITSLVDDGGWYARASDEDFYSAGCGNPKII